MQRTLILITLTIFLSGCTGPDLLFERDESLLTTNIFVAVRAGSRQDPVDKVGVTAMMAELLVRGTKNRTRSEFQQEIEKLGGSLGVSADGGLISISGAVIAENTTPFLKLLEDALLNPRFAKEEFDSLKKEILAGILHAKNSNMSLAMLATQQYLYEGTPMARPTSGSLKSVEAITLEDISKRYQEILHKKNIFFGVTTPLDKKHFKALLKNIYEKLPDGEPQKLETIEPKLLTENQLILVDKPKTQTGSLVMAQQGIRVNDESRFPLGIGNFSFGAVALTARLFKVIRADLGWTYFIRSSYSGLGELDDQKGVYVIRSTPSVEHTTDTIFKVLEMWKEYLAKGLDEKELNLAHESLVNSYPFQFDTAAKRLAMKSRSYLYDIPILDPSDYKKKIEGYGQKDIVAAIQKQHGKQAWLITLVADKKVIEGQLAAANKKLPKDQQLKITKTYTPEEIIQ